MKSHRSERQQRAARRPQRGMMLIEALIAILIFSIGILGIVGLQATAVQQSSDARYRSQAAELAQRLLGRMWTGDRTTTTLQTNYSCDAPPCSSPGTGYAAWLADVSGALPGVATDTSLQPAVTIDSAGVVILTLYWRQPSDDAASRHQYQVQSQISQ